MVIWAAGPLTFVTPVDACDLDLLCRDVLLHKLLPLKSLPQGALSCVSVSTNNNFHLKRTKNVVSHTVAL